MSTCTRLHQLACEHIVWLQVAFLSCGLFIFLLKSSVFSSVVLDGGATFLQMSPSCVFWARMSPLFLQAGMVFLFSVSCVFFKFPPCCFITLLLQSANRGSYGGILKPPPPPPPPPPPAALVLIPVSGSVLPLGLTAPIHYLILLHV